MMMPANFSAVAENELTYVVGGASLVDYLAPAMKAENWQNVSANVIKIVGNTFLKNYATMAFNSVFDGNYVPGDFIGGVWGAGLGILNAALSIAGGLSAIYTLGSGSVGLELKDVGGAKLDTKYFDFNNM